MNANPLQPETCETAPPDPAKVRWRMEALGRLGPGIAHEINTPMQYIGDNTHFLEEAFLDLKKVYEKFQSLLSGGRAGRVSEQLIEEIDTLVTQMDLEYILGEVPNAFRQTHEGLEKIRKMVRGVQHFSQEKTSPKNSADLYATVDNLVNLSRNVWKYVSDLRVDLADNLPGINGDSGDLSLALLYLIDYAVQCISAVITPQSGQKGVITIMAQRVDDTVVIHVGHNGTPPEASLLTQIISNANHVRERQDGEALLAQCYLIVTQVLGGQFMWEMNTGHGTSFIISLPAVSGKQDDNQGDMFIG